MNLSEKTGYLCRSTRRCQDQSGPGASRRGGGAAPGRPRLRPGGASPPRRFRYNGPVMPRQPVETRTLWRVQEGETSELSDWVVVEEPLEIRVQGVTLAILMRPRGHAVE